MNIPQLIRTVVVYILLLKLDFKIVQLAPWFIVSEVVLKPAIIKRKPSNFLTSYWFLHLVCYFFGTKIFSTSNFYNVVVFSLTFLSQIFEVVEDDKPFFELVEYLTTISKLQTKNRLKIIVLFTLTLLSPFFTALDWKEPWQAFPTPQLHAVLLSNLILNLL